MIVVELGIRFSKVEARSPTTFENFWREALESDGVYLDVGGGAIEVL